MKKAIQIFIVSVIIISCKSKNDLNTNKDVMVADTSKMYNSNVLTDTGSVIKTTALPANNNIKTTTTKTVTTVTTTTDGTPVNESVSNRSVHRSGTTSNSAYTTSHTRKRGWSHAATDATVGGVGGAVAGAIISKNHGKGAIIGGVAGAAGGYLLGHSKDKKEGR